MRKKTIGEVLKLARVNQGMSLEELQKKTDIQIDLLKALEADDFDRLPSPFYARSFLRKYAWAVDLDEKIVLEAYESGSMVTYDEIDVDINDTRRSRKNRKRKTSYLPIFYFLVISLAMIAFVTYYVWSYVNHNQLDSKVASSYSVVSDNSSASSESDSDKSGASSSDSSSNDTKSTLTVSGSGQSLTANLSGAKDAVTVKFSVTNATSWVSMTNSDLADGATLSSDNPTVSATLEPGTTSTITLGVVEGVTVTVDDQILNTSALSGQSATITLTIDNEGTS